MVKPPLPQPVPEASQVPEVPEVPEASRAAAWAGFTRGLRKSTSLALGYMPVAFSFGLTAVQAGLPPALAVLISAVVFAGGSQFVMASLIGAGGGLWTVLPTVLLMNARHLLYGRAIESGLAGQRRTLPVPLLAFGMTDEVFVITVGQMHRISAAQREGWYVGLQLGAYLFWVAGTVAGVLAGHELLVRLGWLAPALSFLLPALFLTLLLGFEMPAGWVPAAVSVVATGVLLLLWPAHFAIVLGIVAGAAVQAAKGQGSSLDEKGNNRHD